MTGVPESSQLPLGGGRSTLCSGSARVRCPRRVVDDSVSPVALASRSRGQKSELVATLDTALAALGCPPSDNHVAHALIWRVTA